ncbi:MAG: TetR/AcrR family transcriptional regulator [Ruminiclostridium sp.]|nr:TetR/AcrR family transcriptional regulator [Ruminiclostridium sp.]
MKQKVTRDMIVETGFSIIREEGEAALSVRSVAAKLGCSTQPVMYWYKSVGEMKAAIIERANAFHTEFLTKGGYDDVLIGIGMNYIRFAAEEKNLFRFLVMSDNADGGGIAELMAPDASEDLLKPLEWKYGLTSEQSRDVFEALFSCFHGYAALIAYNAAAYDALHLKKQLVHIYRGVIEDIKSGKMKLSMIREKEHLQLNL